MNNNTRIGLGFDVHRFGKAKKPLILAGVHILCGLSLDAVSDGDVVLHAAADAVCGACGLGDIGDFFSPSDKKNLNLDSKQIVNFILNKIKNKFAIINMDITIIAEKPRLIKHKPAMAKSLENIFSCKNINVKIKSKEGLNILGGVNSIACIVNILVERG
jgi:2-C-methyl-D-erythritol 2,4-cyclodiphosphate synthase